MGVACATRQGGSGSCPPLTSCVNFETNPPVTEFRNRMARLFQDLQRQGDRFDTALVYNRVNQYYLTGTMQDGLLVVRRNGDILYFVRKSYERRSTPTATCSIICPQISAIRSWRWKRFRSPFWSACANPSPSNRFMPSMASWRGSAPSRARMNSRSSASRPASTAT